MQNEKQNGYVYTTIYIWIVIFVVDNVYAYYGKECVPAAF